jgi:hypothetical protein
MHLTIKEHSNIICRDLLRAPYMNSSTFLDIIKSCAFRVIIIWYPNDCAILFAYKQIRPVLVAKSMYN